MRAPGRARPPPDLSSEESLKVSGVWYHIILQTDQPTPHRVSVPDHFPLRLGTFNAILRAVAYAKLVSKDDVIRSL